MFAPQKPIKQRKGRIMVSGTQKGDTYGVITKRLTALSSSETQYVGHTSHGGLNPSKIRTVNRPAAADTEPAYALTDYIDLLLPNEFLVNEQDTTGPPAHAANPDTKVGCDYYNAPRDLIEGMRRARVTIDDSHSSVFMKVNNAKHRLFFTNYSRFPKQVHIQHLIGPVTDEWDFDQPAISSSTRTHFDFANTEEYPDQYSNIETIIIPGANEKTQAGSKVYKDIYCPFNQIFGAEYSDVPATEEFYYPVNGGWIECEPLYTRQGVAGAGITQGFYRLGATNSYSALTNPFSYKIRMFVTTAEPHGHLVQGDGGVIADGDTDDVPLVNGSNSLQSKGLNIEMASRWDCTVKFTGAESQAKHYGAEARQADLL